MTVGQWAQTIISHNLKSYKGFETQFCMENRKPTYGALNVLGTEVRYEMCQNHGKYNIKTANDEDFGKIIAADGRTKDEAKENLLEAILKDIEK